MCQKNEEKSNGNVKKEGGRVASPSLARTARKRGLGSAEANTTAWISQLRKRRAEKARKPVADVFGNLPKRRRERRSAEAERRQSREANKRRTAREKCPNTQIRVAPFAARNGHSANGEQKMSACTSFVRE
jgi:hypothetical protein